MILPIAVLGVLVLLCVGACAPATPTATVPIATSQEQSDSPPSEGRQVTSDEGYSDAIGRIAEALERLASDYPQLSDFSASEHCDRQRLVISYGYRTHRSEHRGGWTSGVPNPDDDGVWLYVDLHEPDSTAQIHTQPVVPARMLGAKKVMVLLLEGKATRGLGPALEQILRDSGVRPQD